jgi:hypothetical protein
MVTVVDLNLAYAQISNDLDENGGSDLSEAVVPAFDFDNNFDKSIMVLLNFTALNKAEFVGGDVSYGPPHSNIGNPDSLRLQIYDYNGDILEQFNYWHPLYNFEFQDDGNEYLNISQSAAVGRFVYAFDPNAALMKVSYLHHEGINNTWAEEVISVDLIPIISAFCAQFRDDPDCRSSDLSVVDVDVSTSGGQEQLTLPIGSSADITVQTTVTNTGPDAPIDATLSSKVSTPSGPDGVLVTPAAGANPNDDGATATTIVTSLNQRQQHDQTYTIECWEPGIHDLIFQSKIASQSGAVIDANPLNNNWQRNLEVNCGVNSPLPPAEPLSVSIQANVTEDGSPPTTIEFGAITDGGTEPYKFRWNFDDGSNNNIDVRGDQSMTHQFTRLGQYNVRAVVTDSANGSLGQTASDNIIITISDREPPRFSVPSKIIVEATGPDGATVTFTVSATDIVDGSVPVDCTPRSGSIFRLNTTTTVNCEATDSSGNTGYGSFPVTVQDTTPPILELPNIPPVEATGPDGATVTFTVSATDIVDGTATLEEDGITITQDNVGGDITILCNPASGYRFPLNTTTTVNCEATDSSGNTGYGSFPVTVQDTTPPTLTVPPSITVEATGQDDTIVASTPALSINPLIISLQANSASASAATPDILFVQTSPPPGAIVRFFVTATDIVDGTATLGKEGGLIQDNVGGDITILCNPASGYRFPLNTTTTVNCEATDSSGNTGYGSFPVTVQDTTPPPPPPPPPAIDDPPADDPPADDPPADDPPADDPPAEETTD